MTAAVNSIPREVLAPARPDIAPSRGRAEVPMIAVLSRMSGETGAPPTRLLREFAALSFGQGKLAFTDYARLRLYDDAFWAGVDKKSVVGARRGREICQALNQGQGGQGLCSNRLAMGAYLAAFGFPVAALVAVFARGVAAPGQGLLRSRGELRQFLTSDAPYPLFACPTDGGSNAGGGVLLGCDCSSGILERADGQRTPVDNFIDDVSEHGRFLFQRLVIPHPSVAALCGARMAGVRLVTVTTEQGPRLFRACWRIPVADTAGGGSLRSGDLLARVDIRTGAVLRVTRGLGPDLQELTRHPATGARLIGAMIPDWEAMKATAVEAARAMRPLAMIGWEIAPSDAGPVILRVSETPDLALHQLVDGKGLLDGDFIAFMADRRHAAAEQAELSRPHDREAIGAF